MSRIRGGWDVWDGTMDGIEVGLGGSVRICQDLSGSSHAEDLASGDLFKHVFGLGLDTLTISFSPLGSSTKKQRRDSSNLRMIYVERADAHFYMRICVCMCMRMRMRMCMCMCMCGSICTCKMVHMIWVRCLGLSWH